MKVILFLLLFLSILAFGGVSFSRGFTFDDDLFSRSVCDKSLGYRIGNIDERFNLTEEQLVSRLGEAEAIWENSSKRDLFAYESTSALTINLVYDRRQSLHSEINQLTDTLEQGKGDFKAKKRDYEARAGDFEKRLGDFNSQVEYWNNKGGAPPEEYAQLIKIEEELRAEASRLNALAEELNISASEYNSQVGRLNSTIDEFNQALSRKPEEGLYDPETKTIEIFFVVNAKELVHTIAHELGHALELPHNQNPHSIMFPFSTEVTTASSDDIEAVNLLCKEKSILEILSTHTSLLIEKYR